MTALELIIAIALVIWAFILAYRWAAPTIMPFKDVFDEDYQETTIWLTILWWVAVIVISCNGLLDFKIF